MPSHWWLAALAALLLGGYRFWPSVFLGAFLVNFTHPPTAGVVPVCLGSLAGAFTIARVDDALFQRLFGIVMLLDVIPMIWRRKIDPTRPARSWPRWLAFLAFLAIGLYGGAIQAGVGLLMVSALTHDGYDLIRANSIKVSVNVVLTAFAIAFGAVMIGLAIAFGIGGASLARRFLEQQFPERPPGDPDRVSHL